MVSSLIDMGRGGEEAMLGTCLLEICRHEAVNTVITLLKDVSSLVNFQF